MITPYELKNIIISTIKKYHLEYCVNNIPKYSSDEVHEKSAYESRKGNNLIQIARLCLQHQEIIDHITYMININNEKIINDFYTKFKLAEFDEKSNIYNDNQLSIKLYPLIIYLYIQIFRDTSLNANNVLDFFKNVVQLRFF
jgi:hypothetical protein